MRCQARRPIEGRARPRPRPASKASFSARASTPGASPPQTSRWPRRPSRGSPARRAGSAPAAGAPSGVGPGLGVITGLASKAGAKPPVTEEQAYLNMALDLLGGLSAPVTLGMGPAVASALKFAMADWFRPSIPHQVREDLDTMRGQSI